MNLPIIKLEIDGIRHQVIHAFAQHNSEIEIAVNEEFKRQIDAFNFSDAVTREFRTAMESAIRSAIERYFYEGGGRALVAAKVQAVLRTLEAA